MFDELKEVKYFKEKGLRSVHAKVETYLEPNQEPMMNLFSEYS